MGRIDMIFTRSPVLPEVFIIESDVFEDNRGLFTELYHQEKFEEAGIKVRFVQDNLSRSHKGTIRGLHYQLGRPQGKLVWALSGSVFDVTVDIRKGSPNFGKWFGITLSDDNRKALYVPPDFAHGFCALSKKADFFYKCTDFYSPLHERCIRWDDPDLGIEWPLDTPIVSKKDAASPFLKDAELPL
jgi:dTDP-4-dehydrorhamnose 3,5-epimerase